MKRLTLAFLASSALGALALSGCSTGNNEDRSSSSDIPITANTAFKEAMQQAMDLYNQGIRDIAWAHKGRRLPVPIHLEKGVDPLFAIGKAEVTIPLGSYKLIRPEDQVPATGNAIFVYKADDRVLDAFERLMSVGPEVTWGLVVVLGEEYHDPFIEEVEIKYEE